MKKPIRKGNVIVFTGPSGVGKGSIVSQLLKRHDDIVLSVSATTRPPRKGEQDGVEYHFLPKEKFMALVNSGQMLEWAEFADNFYGTFKQAVEKEVDEGKDVILEIEVQGAMQVKAKMPEVVMIFVLPPSVQELRRRITGRATEVPEIIEKRMNIAAEEIKMADRFDYKVINDDLGHAIKEVEDIIMSLR